MSSEGTAGVGLLLVLSAPSGAGKTTLAHGLKARLPDAVFSISATTRPPRGAEKDGVDYHFVSPEGFEELLGAGALSEWAEVHGHRYGTLRSTVDAALTAGRVALFDIDVQGGELLKAAWPDRAATVLVLPPSPEELARRLRGRSTDSEVDVARRLAVARLEMARGLKSYEYVVVNDELERALGCLFGIVRYERARQIGATDEEASAVAKACLREAASLGDWGG
jgi:guanylate kinase